jgi:hypothetical protein
VIYARVLLLAALLGGGFLAGWTVQGWRWRAADADRLEQQREARRGQEHQIAGAATRHEATRATLQVQRQVLTEETDRAIAAAPDWHADLCFSADGLRQLAAARDGPADPGQPAAALPAASSPE